MARVSKAYVNHLCATRGITREDFFLQMLALDLRDVQEERDAALKKMQDMICDTTLPEHLRANAHKLMDGILTVARDRDAMKQSLTAAKLEIHSLRHRLRSAAGDDLCRLTQEEISDLSKGGVKIPPKEEFLASCERFHTQIAGEAGVLHDCMTLAQLLAENERLRADNENMLWNLGGISTVANSRVPLTGHNEQMERPALRDVIELVHDHKKVRDENIQLKKDIATLQEQLAAQIRGHRERDVSDGS